MLHYFNLSLLGSLLLISLLLGVLGFIIVVTVLVFIISFVFEGSKRIFKNYISGFELKETLICQWQYFTSVFRLNLEEKRMRFKE